MRLLDTINSPEDLKKIPLEKLPELADEIRQLIIQTVNRNGGHLASNLGVVELTIALHRVFDSPRDIIMFDVSHQSYAHKILTGRRQGFAGIRTSGGYSGYFDKDESPHDILTLGHAGAAPSLALGIATAKKLRHEEGIVVCVIGDGGMTNGLAYEGLSNIVARNPENLIVVLNDNGMAINENVGWMTIWRDKWLPHLRNHLELDPDFQEFERITRNLSEKVPGGSLILDIAKGMKSTIQRAVIPGIGQFWEEMGFHYLGPVDGHNINAIVEILKASGACTRVPLIHVLTSKGQGFAPAKSDPVHFHQPGPNGIPKQRETYSQFFGRTLRRLMENNDKIVAISAAMLEGTGLSEVKRAFPERVFDVGICEGHAVSLAAGLARAGLRPVVCIYSTFLQRSLDQIIHDVAMNDLPVVFAIDRAGLVGQDGKTHHGLFDLAYMRLVPNMIVAAPWNEEELASLLVTAFSQEHPFSIRYPRAEILGMPQQGTCQPLPVGTSQTIYHGDKVCLVAVGSLVEQALRAYQILRGEDIDVGVVNLRYIKPVDQDLVFDLMEQYAEMIVLEEGASCGGAAAAILEAMTAHQKVVPKLHRFSTGDCFPEHGEVQELKAELGIDAGSIAAKVREIVRGGVQ